MDKAKQLVHKHQDQFKWVLLIGSGIAAFNTLARPDYNLIIYLYMFYVWNNMNDSKETQANEKINSFFISLYSLLIDFVWVFYWGGRWSYIKVDNEGLIHFLVLFLSWVGIFLKVW
jgi:hypothetical protein